MKDIVDSLAEYFKARMKTQVYGTFTFWWVVLHWEFLYVLIFEDEKAIYRQYGILKHEYLRSRFVDYENPNFWMLQVGLFLIAAAMTYLMIWIVPKIILLRAYGQEKEHKFDKELIKINFEKERQVELAKRDKVYSERLERISKKIEVEKKVAKADPRVLWEEEFERFKESHLYHSFDRLVECLYSRNGRVNYGGFVLSQDILAYSETNGLVDFDRNTGTISLEDKGKYFIQRYQSDT